MGETGSTDRATVLVIPGLDGSGPAHWQSIWERRDPSLRRVEQASFSRPRLGDWALELERAVREAAGPVVLAAHSLGCALVAHWSQAGTADRVAAALLVAPADVERLDRVSCRSFSPVPLVRLPFATWLVASEDDPCCGLDRARAFARGWGARFLAAGRAGHINVASGHGPWPEGEALLAELRRSAAAWRAQGQPDEAVPERAGGSGGRESSEARRVAPRSDVAEGAP